TTTPSPTRSSARSRWCCAARTGSWRWRANRSPRCPTTSSSSSRSHADMAAYDVNLRLWRGDASGGELRDYTVGVEDGEVVLDAIHRVQATQAGDLAVRWNCKAGKCGSCSAEVNGS